MRTRNRALTLTAVGSLMLCTACLDLVVSVYPWFEIDGDATDVVFDARLLGGWCVDDDDCGETDLWWEPGPEDSYNIFENDEPTYRAWLAEIGGTSFVAFAGLCEPALDTARDSCYTGVRGYFVTRLEWQAQDVVELRHLDRERLEAFLGQQEKPLAHGTPYGDLVLVEETETLRMLLERFGKAEEFWVEPTTLTRSR